MRFRSSGLGKTELRGDLSEVSVHNNDLLIAHFQTTEPVQWHLRAALEPADIPKLMKVIFKPSLIFMVVKCLFSLKKNPKEPDDIMAYKLEVKPQADNKEKEKEKTAATV